MPQQVVEERKTIDITLVIDGENVRVETPWAVSVMPTEKVVNMVMAYGSLSWKESMVGSEPPGRKA